VPRFLHGPGTRALQLCTKFKTTHVSLTFSQENKKSNCCEFVTLSKVKVVWDHRAYRWI